MLEHTPKSHADYIPTFGLLHSTELVIKVMTEVKIREDEYDLVKSMSQRIKGLPSLAKRGRRLLFQGQLLRVRRDPSDETSLRPPPFNEHSSLHLGEPPAPARRSSSLVDAIHDWDQRRERSGSVKSNVSSSTTASFSSYSDHSSTASSELPRTPSSPHFPSRSAIPIPKSKLAGSSRSSVPQEVSRPYPNTPSAPRLEETQAIHVLVFTDCVVVAASKSRHNGSEEWTLLETVGIGRVLSVKEFSEESNSASPFYYSLCVLTV